MSLVVFFPFFWLGEMGRNARLIICLYRPALGKTYKVSAQAAVLNHGLPNYFFHLNTGYSILRSKGVPVGKKDYLSSFLLFV